MVQSPPFIHIGISILIGSVALVGNFTHLLSADAYQGVSTVTDSTIPSKDQLLYAVGAAWQWTLAALFMGSSLMLIAGVILQFGNNMSHRYRGRDMIWGGLLTLASFAYFFYTLWDGAGFVFISDQIHLPLFSGGRWPADLADDVFVASSFIAKVAFTIGCGVLIYRRVQELHGARRVFFAFVSALCLYLFVAVFVLYLHGQVIDVVLDNGVLTKLLIVPSLLAATMLLFLTTWIVIPHRKRPLANRAGMFQGVLWKVLVVVALGCLVFITATGTIYLK
jgi:hypothetical protein